MEWGWACCLSPRRSRQHVLPTCSSAPASSPSSIGVLGVPCHWPSIRSYSATSPSPAGLPAAAGVAPPRPPAAARPSVSCSSASSSSCSSSAVASDAGSSSAASSSAAASACLPAGAAPFLAFLALQKERGAAGAAQQQVRGSRRQGAGAANAHPIATQRATHLAPWPRASGGSAALRLAFLMAGDTALMVRRGASAAWIVPI